MRSPYERQPHRSNSQVDGRAVKMYKHLHMFSLREETTNWFGVAHGQTMKSLELILHSKFSMVNVEWVWIRNCKPITDLGTPTLKAVLINCLSQRRYHELSQCRALHWLHGHRQSTSKVVVPHVEFRVLASQEDLERKMDKYQVLSNLTTKARTKQNDWPRVGVYDFTWHVYRYAMSA